MPLLDTTRQSDTAATSKSCHEFSGLVAAGTQEAESALMPTTRWLVFSGLDQCDKHNPPLVWGDFFCYITFCLFDFVFIVFEQP